MQKTQRLFALISILTLLASSSLAEDPTKQKKKQTVAPAAASNPVVGSGAAGQITKWTGVEGSNTYTIGDTNITEDKFGKVGIGTRTPTSQLTVRGSIETTLGGFKFPDGTIQTTAGIANVFHNSTLQGSGASASPLGVAVPLNLSGSLPVPVLSAINSANGDGVSGFSANRFGVFGNSSAGDGVRGESSSGAGVSGFSRNVGVSGESTNGNGVVGISASGFGVVGSGGTAGVIGNSTNGNGVLAQGGTHSSGFGSAGARAHGGMGSGVGLAGGDGIFASGGLGIKGATNGRAASFDGDVQITGNLSATGAKMFKIDHPLDPENKYLNHAAIESSEVLNVYSGNTTTDQNGDAIVSMPEWCEALNKDFRYQLTVIGTFAQAIVAEKIKGNHFAIKSNAPNVEVSWQVTGVRNDRGMRRHQFKIEEEKSERERGHYLTPEAFDQPEEKSIEWARHPEMMQKLKQERLDAEEKIKKQQQR